MSVIQAYEQNMGKTINVIFTFFIVKHVVAITEFPPDIIFPKINKKQTLAICSISGFANLRGFHGTFTE